MGKSWRINPRDDYGQLSLGDILGSTGGYFVVAVPTGMDDEYAAHLMAASELMYEALTWAVEYMEQYDGEVMPGWREFQERGRAALNAATPPTASGAASTTTEGQADG